jgi:ribose transport system permease protein
MKKIKNFLSDNVALVGLVCVFILGTIIQPAFLSLDNLGNLFRSASIVGLISIGMLFVVLCGSIDISVGAIFALAGYLFISLAQTNPILAIVAPLLTGVIVGALNAYLIDKMRIPAFISTLAVMMLCRGIVLLVTKESTVRNGDLSIVLKSLGRGNLLTYISFPIIFFSVISLLSAYFLRKYAMGRNMYIVGGNADAAVMMGVNKSRTMFTAHILCSVLACFAGIIFASRVGSAAPLAGTGYEMYAIAAVVIGGAQLDGGIGKVSGTFLGALIMGSFSNIFNLQKFINAVWQDAIIGIVLLAVIMIQAVIHMGLFSFVNKNKLKLYQQERR